jgi:hypothetical protein
MSHHAALYAAAVLCLGVMATVLGILALLFF